MPGCRDKTGAFIPTPACRGYPAKKMKVVKKKKAASAKKIRRGTKTKPFRTQAEALERGKSAKAKGLAVYYTKGAYRKNKDTGRYENIKDRKGRLVQLK